MIFFELRIRGKPVKKFAALLISSKEKLITQDKLLSYKHFMSVDKYDTMYALSRLHCFHLF